ncbi:MAG TPA: 4Fe-4S binding protein [bacterium]|nr:4Fe-4S binding protein [bacterium]
MKIASMLNDVFRSTFRRPFTELYPYRQKPAPPGLRGKLLWDESKCDGCKLCVRDCPARAIEVEVVDRAAKKFAYHYRTDRCIYCAQCVVSCKEGALSMSSTLYHLASTDKRKFTEVYHALGDGACVEEDDGEVR